MFLLPSRFGVAVEDAAAIVGHGCQLLLLVFRDSEAWSRVCVTQILYAVVVGDAASTHQGAVAGGAAGAAIAAFGCGFRVRLTGFRPFFKALKSDFF